MAVENLNLITRRELADSQKHVSGEAFRQLELMLDRKPHVTGIDALLDLYLVDLSADIIGEISYALEGVTWEIAESYARKVEKGTNTSEDDQHYQYWQSLQEKWGYLEMAAD